MVEGGVSIHYFFGPGQLRDVKVSGEIDPLNPKLDEATAQFHCSLHIPAEAGIKGTVGGGIGLDVLVASASGTLTVGADLSLNGVAGGPLDITYDKKKLAVEAKPGLDASLNLGLSLDAHARANALGFEYEKNWNLGQRAVLLGAFGMHAPIKWNNDGGFKPPGLDQIEWTLPEVNFDNVLKQLMASAPAREEKK